MEMLAVVIISSIWTVFSGFFIYHFAFDNSNTFLYILLCWVSIAPLAGAIIYSSLSDTRKEKNSNFEIIGALSGLGILIGLVVSVVDYLFFSEPFLDFVCDLIEIGFGYFAIASYHFYKLLVVKLISGDGLPNISSKNVRQNINSNFDAQLKKLQDVKQKQDMEKKYNEILEKMKNHSLKYGMNSLNESERALFKKCVFDKVKKYGLKNENICQIEVFYYLEEMGKRRQQQEEAKAREKEKRAIEEKRAQEFEKKLKNLKKEFIEDINNTLSQSSYGEYVIIGTGDYYESRYYLNDYPVERLKDKTEKYLEKLAKMTKEELKREEQRVYVAEQKRKAWEEEMAERSPM